MEQEIYLSEKEFSLFCDVISSFHTIIDMDEMIASILQQIQIIVDAEGASIALHDSVHKEFYFIRTAEELHGETSQESQAMRFPDSKGIAGWVLHNLATAVIDDVTKDPRYYNEFDADTNFLTHSMICVPLKTKKGFLGILYALNKKNGTFSQREKKILEWTMTEYMNNPFQKTNQ